MTDLPFGTPNLRQRTRLQLEDAALRTNLRQVTDRLSQARATALSQLEDADALKEIARALRARALDRLPDLLSEFADRLLASGAHIHWATDGESARTYITDVARRHKVRKVVKSKSMAAEEIHLNPHLERQGISVVETDLGEWIVQQAKESPSHIIVPAIHKNRRQIAEVLGQDTEQNPASSTPAFLAAHARTQLRNEFLTADMGISGTNFGVAAAGSLILVTNEGNGRLVTSLPRVHVAIMGMERIVADFDELDVMLALLPRAATGQTLTAYTSVISGPRQASELDGPEELHVVILDNGRSSIIGTEFQEILHCIRCGACLNVCPVYQQIGGHGYGTTYSGPIGSVLTPLLDQSEGAQELAKASTLCGACWKTCPVGIPIQDLLLALRRRAPKRKARHRLLWRAWSFLWSLQHSYRVSLLFVRWLTALAHLSGGRGIPFVRNWTIGRSIPSVIAIPSKRKQRRS